MDLLPRFLPIAAALLPPAGSTVVVAVSGGADSVALWDLLARARRWPLVVWHLDHRLRDDSPADAELIGARAAAYAAEGFGEARLVIEREDVAARARERRGSLETIGRDIRYERLRALAQACGAAAVAVAHHRDDQAETVLANLLRGAGPVGRGGMPPSRALAPGVALVRPLLGFPRDDLRAHLASRGLAWREDATNADRAFRRNFLRHAVLPTFERGAPGFAAALAALADDSRAHVADRAGAADAFWNAALVGDRLRLAGIAALERESRLLVWRRLLRRLALPLARRHLRALDLLATGEGGGRYALGAVEFQRLRGALAWPVRAPADAQVVAIVRAGRYRRGPESLTIARMAPPSDARAPADIAWLDADAVVFPLAWRLVEPGERWRPLGAPGTQAVSKTMAERGVPSRSRAAQAVVADRGGVLWVPGVAVCERARITEATLRALRLAHASEALALSDLADYARDL